MFSSEVELDLDGTGLRGGALMALYFPMAWTQCKDNAFKDISFFCFVFLLWRYFIIIIFFYLVFYW